MVVLLNSFNTTVNVDIFGSMNFVRYTFSWKDVSIQYGYIAYTITFHMSTPINGNMYFLFVTIDRPII